RARLPRMTGRDRDCLEKERIHDDRQAGSLADRVDTIAGVAGARAGAGRAVPRQLGLVLAPGRGLPARRLLAAALLGPGCLLRARLRPPVEPGPVPAGAVCVRTAVL